MCQSLNRRLIQNSPAGALQSLCFSDGGLLTLNQKCFLCRDLTFVDVPVAQPPLDTKQPGRGVTKVAVDLQWTNPDVQLATVQLFEAIAAQDVLHSKQEQRAALTQLLQVSLLHVVVS
jgi:hypothetical protein